MFIEGGNVRSFENSPTNVKRSIATFYSSGVMGKRKYQAVRVALSMKKSEKKGEEIKHQYHAKMPHSKIADLQ